MRDETVQLSEISMYSFERFFRFYVVLRVHCFDFVYGILRVILLTYFLWIFLDLFANFVFFNC